MSSGDISFSSNPSGAEAYCSACGQSFPYDTDVCPNDGARLVKLGRAVDALIGRVFENRYEVRGPLGSGGMGMVYRGWQMSVDREVVIKVIDHRLTSDRVSVKRFLREARLASRLSQPNIVNIYDFGQSDDGILYIVMELLRGKTLGQTIGGRSLGVRRSATIAAQLCDALEAAHAQTIVHRDLKPGNIIVLDDPPGRDLIKVLDFGLAKSLAGDAMSRVTKTDTVLGTPLYMSPEQIDGKPTDARADLYSFGCIFYEMLVGKPPFVDQNMHAVLARHMSEPPPPLPPGIPAGLNRLIVRMLAKLPEDRTQSAAEVRRGIAEAMEGGVPDVVASLPPTGERSAPAFGVAMTMSSDGSMPVAPRRGRGKMVAGLVVGALALGAGVGGAVHLLTTKDKPAGAPPDATRAGAAPSDGPAVVIDAPAVAVDAPAAIIDAPVAEVDAAVADAPPPSLDAAVPARPDAGPSRPPPHRPPPVDAAVPPQVDAGPPPLDYYPSKK